nr:MAG TPA: hypothetical protein [Caudoviricetes sp.]
MIINELEGLNYYINEKEAFGKSIFNPSQYTVPLAIEAGTPLDNYIEEGQQVSGSYDVNGTTTSYEGIIQDIAISRDYQAGYDMYNLTMSENVLMVARQSLLDVPDGGTGASELNGVLKGNGVNPVSQAADGVDYWSPETLKPVTLNGDWLVEHLGGQNYRLTQIYRVSTSCTQAHQGQFMSDVIKFPALPVGFATVPISFAMTNSTGNTGPAWLFNQNGGVRIKTGASTNKVVMDLALTCITTMS